MLSISIFNFTQIIIKKKKDTNKKDSNHSHKVGKPKINLSLENLNSHMSYKTPTMAIELVDQELDK